MQRFSTNAADHAKRTRISARSALFQGLCPRCRQGKIYENVLRMHERCPHCGMKFEREQGYFLGAMGVSYLLGVPVLSALIALWSFGIFPEWPAYKAILPAALIFLPSVPFVCQYSRIIWIHFDRWVDPDTSDLRTPKQVDIA